MLACEMKNHIKDTKTKENNWKVDVRFEVNKKRKQISTYREQITLKVLFVKNLVS